MPNPTTVFVPGTIWADPAVIFSPSQPPSTLPVEEQPSTPQPINHYYKKFAMSVPDSKKPWHSYTIMDLYGSRFKPKNGEIGLEIECEGMNLFNSPLNYWSCHSDGSLRQYKGHPPVEYVLTEPLNYSTLVTALDYLNYNLLKTKSFLVTSSRTSVHVHINCQQLTVKQLFNYILLYIIFEEILIEKFAPERAGNLFCLRAKDSEFYLSMLENAITKHSFQGWKEELRYSACNISSIPKFGSLEFRSLRGTVDSGTILNWVCMLLNLKQAALSYESPISIVEDFLNLGPLPFFRKIFSDPAMRADLQLIPDLSSKLWVGLRLMRDVAYASKWSDTLKKKKLISYDEE